MIDFTPLSSGISADDGQTKAQPFAYLLEVDDIRILLDCGIAQTDEVPLLGRSDDESETVSGVTNGSLSEELGKRETTMTSATTEELNDAEHLKTKSETKDEVSVKKELDVSGPDGTLQGGEVTTDASNGDDSTVKTEVQDQRSDGSKTGIGMESYERTLKALAPTIDLVLLSHASLEHTGLYAYAHAHWGLTCPAYATLPTQSLARISSINAALVWRAERNLSDPSLYPDHLVPTLQECHRAFDHVQPLRYSQPKVLSNKLKALTLTAFMSGHTLGGTLWRIRTHYGIVLCALRMNHVKERHLDGTFLLSKTSSGKTGVMEALYRPALLITDAERALVHTAKRKDRDNLILQTIHQTLSAGRSILVPCDASSRILELIIMFHTIWAADPKLHSCPLILISETAQELLDKARSLFEWFGGSVSEYVPPADSMHNQRAGFQAQEHDPLAFRFLRIFPDINAMQQALPYASPRLIMATPMSLACGPSRRLFSVFAQRTGDVLLMTSRGDHGSLLRRLFDLWNAAQTRDRTWDSGQTGQSVCQNMQLDVPIHARVPLTGEELQAHMAAEQEKVKAAEEAERRAAAQKKRTLEADADDSESDDDQDEDMNDLQDGGGEMLMNRPTKRSNKNLENEDSDMFSFDIFIRGQETRHTSFFKTADSLTSQRYRMFPFYEKHKSVGEFGQNIDANRWRQSAEEANQLDHNQHGTTHKRQKVEKPQQVANIEIPSKYETYPQTLTLACELLFVDLDGLNDGKAIKTILPQVNPRKMVLVSGTASCAQDLQNTFETVRGQSQEIFCPARNQTVKVGEYTHSFPLKLGSKLLDGLKMHRYEDMDIAQVQGQFIFEEDSSVPTLEVVSADDSAELGTLEKMQRATAEDCSTAQNTSSLTLPTIRRSTTLYIGDVKLAQLKDRLSALGLRATLAGEGVLVCGSLSGPDVAAVRKSAKGQLLLQGNLSIDDDVYFTVRQQVYASLAVI